MSRDPQNRPRASAGGRSAAEQTPGGPLAADGGTESPAGAQGVPVRRVVPGPQEERYELRWRRTRWWGRGRWDCWSSQDGWLGWDCYPRGFRSYAVQHVCDIRRFDAAMAACDAEREAGLQRLEAQRPPKVIGVIRCDNGQEMKVYE